MFRPVLRSQVLFDVIVAVLLGVVLLLLRTAGWAPLDVVIVAGLTVSLALRRLSPGLALGIAWAFAVLQMATGLGPDPADLLIAGVMFTTSAYGSSRVRLAGLLSAVGGALIAAGYVGLQDAQQQHRFDYSRSPMEFAQLVLGTFAGVLLVLLLPWLAGLVRRTRRLASVSREAQLLAERDAARADRAVAVEQERVRIARDMHDIVAHSLAVVIAQADGARYALKADPAIADQALTTISGTARRALGDVRELLGALRHEQGTAPTPDVDDIE
ncbi:MAG: histidine kinase dimerization/phosphoacceptor domain-containing protein, partial [Curtobacterium sp.]